MDERVKSFFDWSEIFDHMVTRRLSHIKGAWELTWDCGTKSYKEEDGSFAKIINELVIELSELDPPLKYHDNEDRLVEYCKESLGLEIEKVGNRWVGNDYGFVLEQGGFKDFNQKNLSLAACGRVKAAIERGQLHFDDMEEFHRRMLADVIVIIFYHREVYE